MFRLSAWANPHVRVSPTSRKRQTIEACTRQNCSIIERLARTVNSGGRAWRNAWNALTPAAWYTLIEAHRGRPMPLFADVPPPAKIAPIIPTALKLARQNSKRMLYRDHAAIAVIRAYWYATQHHPELTKLSTKNARAFIDGVGKIYSKYGLLPGQGLGAISSAKTLDRLIKIDSPLTTV